MAQRSMTAYMTSIMMLVATGMAAVAAQRTMGVSGLTDVTKLPRCGAGGYLVPNDNDCVINEIMGSNGTLAFTFRVNTKSKMGLLVTLRSIGAEAVMRLISNDDGTTYDGTIVYFNDAVTESIVRVRPEQLTAGQYTLLLQGTGGATPKMLIYLRFQTPPADIMLAAADKTAMLSLMRECCPTDPYDAPPICSTYLPAGLNAKDPSESLCNMGPFVCNAQGHLEKIDFSNAGLQCKRFPPAFGQFPALETLMLRYNDFNGDSFSNVAKAFSRSTALRRIMLGSTNITGEVPCELFEQHALKTVMFSINKLTGTLPACVLESTTLEELYMSRTTLTGELPDVIPVGSNLRVWYSINQDQETGQSPGPGFSGPIPSSIANAKGLSYVELSGHQLTGAVPPLPEGIRMFEAFNNDLDGDIASPMPAGLVYLDVMNNSLTGPIPDVSACTDLTLMDLSMNQLTGGLPATWGAGGNNLAYLDLSENNLEGSTTEGQAWERVPMLQFAFAHTNNFEGPIPASLGASRNLVALDMSQNRLSGNLKAFSSAIRPALPDKGSKARPVSGTSPPGEAPTAGGRRLAAASGASTAAHVTITTGPAAPMIARKLFGSSEEAASHFPASWQLDVAAVRSLAAHEAPAARRRLLQTAPQEVPAAGGATTTTVANAVRNPAPAAAAAVPAPAAPAAAPAATTGPATTAQTSLSDTPEEPTLASDTPKDPMLSAADPQDTPVEEQDPSASAPATTTAAAAPDAAAQGGANPYATGRSSTANPMQRDPQAPQPVPDIGLQSVPTSSALAGNAFLYLNASGNAITGDIPEEIGNLEMFRSPGGSSDPYDMYITRFGSHARSLDLGNNQLYGPFPMFLIKQAPELESACRCRTDFQVSEGNFLYCPTKAHMEGVKVNDAMLNVLSRQNYTCRTASNEPEVPLAKYISNKAGYITEVPEAPAFAPLPEREPSSSTLSTAAPNYPSGDNAQATGGGSGGGLGPGAIAGIVIGVVAGLAIIGCLAYFVGYKKLYTEHKATSFKRGQIPDGPGLDGHGARPAAAYGGAAAGAGAGAAGVNGFDIETPSANGARS